MNKAAGAEAGAAIGAVTGERGGAIIHLFAAMGIGEVFNDSLGDGLSIGLFGAAVGGAALAASSLAVVGVPSGRVMTIIDSSAL